MFPLFITHDEYFLQCGGNGGGYTTMFLICPTTIFLVDKNSLMYSLHTNIVPQYGYEGTNQLALPVECGEICAAADTQPFLPGGTVGYPAQPGLF